ncbi:hypothetical protein [Flavobacterium reichenbachii]|uniref:Uncharacterized protein n=1 Tax=Flavobacterium reichenbachii TaxID=362418 RepID=A0A085ZS49_9FLAO|nr:hypothetical protein [Flavobacterium reichenbachii]KFF07263.1 hypothetical protein IW19_17890 [Flavobacterium reichenbachii]OXB13248.1 hypothetical protein B0A68_15930 [Flavobacterium reichenbachii]
MNKKKAVILTIILLLGIGSYYLINQDFIKRFYNLDDESSKNKNLTEQEIVIKEPNVFVGDEGYMLKGKLLDKKFEKEFNALPDTLYIMEFNDYLYPVDNKIKTGDTGYSLIQDNTIKNINNYSGTIQQNELISYLKLAVKLAAEFPIFASSENRYDALISNEEFNNTYKTYFAVTEDNYGISQLPSDVKKKIIDFYQSDQGDEYRYKIKGEQTSTDLIWKGELTGKGKKEFAILFNKKSDLEDRYMLLVYATKNLPYQKNKDYYLVYNEIFYDRVLLKHLKFSIEGEDYINEVYMGNENKEMPKYDGILLQQMNMTDEVLVYNEKFDRMVKYSQLPESKLNRETESEEN